jgi:glycosyltransferase involved in cell wall biosynthesis
MTSPTVSVVTPTYDRSATLPRLYESLCAQSWQDFEWILVDDGSTDDTAELVKRWQAQGRLAITYIQQENSGRHIALNRGIAEARAEYCAVIDSDDWYEPQALARMIGTWREIKDEDRPTYANVEGLCADPSGAIIGTRFPEDVVDSDNFEIVAWLKCSGDRKGMYRTSVLREFPFPEVPRIFIPEAVVFFRIADRYRSRFVNEVWARNEYLPSGISRRSLARQLESAEGRRLYNQTILTLNRRRPLLLTLKAYANLARYSFHAGVGLRIQIGDAPRPELWLATLPLGGVLYFADRVRVALEEPAAPRSTVVRDRTTDT